MFEEEQQGTQVARGRHVVPNGVAIEELDGGKKKLADERPAALQQLLDEKGLNDVYDRLVELVSRESKTRNVFGRWKDTEFVSILDLFREDFADKGVKVALCKRSSGAGTFRWLEFIDVDVAGDYVPQFDVGNLSGQVIKTVYTTLEFPNGVAVEELKQYGKARKQLKEKMPTLVEDMMIRKGLMEEYNDLVDHCVQAGIGNWKGWRTDKLNAIIKAHQYQFEAKGVAIFLAFKQEYVHHGDAGHMENFRWIEFVDRAEQPNYYPQRDADTRREEKCIVM